VLHEVSLVALASHPSASHESLHQVGLSHLEAADGAPAPTGSDAVEGGTGRVQRGRRGSQAVQDLSAVSEVPAVPAVPTVQQVAQGAGAGGLRLPAPTGSDHWRDAHQHKHKHRRGGRCLVALCACVHKGGWWCGTGHGGLR
jgi:hypothetical protein